MNSAYLNWLNENGLTEVFTTNAGDTLYANTEKKFFALRKSGEVNIQSFYFKDVVEIKTKDDEIDVVEWNACMPTCRIAQKGTRFSTNEVYCNFKLSNQVTIKLQIFRAGRGGNISRSSNDHIGLINYACQLSQIILSYIQGTDAN